jgi:hypothetical protein
MEATNYLMFPGPSEEKIQACIKKIQKKCLNSPSNQEATQQKQIEIFINQWVCKYLIKKQNGF